MKNSSTSLSTDFDHMKRTDLAESVFREEIDGFQIWLLGRDRFDDFNRFVYGVYSEAFVENGEVQFTIDDIIQSSNAYFDRAKVCAITDREGVLLGTWGLIVKKRGEAISLPIENEFGLKPDGILKAVEAPDALFLFNGWRTAIDKRALEKRGLESNRSIFVFDLLLRGLTEDFVNPALFVGVAEMEKLVLRYHRRIGIPWVVLGESHHFWGRDRYPCAFRLIDYHDHLRENHPERYKLVWLRG